MVAELEPANDMFFPNTIVSVEDLWLKYINSDWILRGVNLQVDEGTCTLVIGSSGGGKTTLARALCGLAGRVFRVELKGRIRICRKSLPDIDAYGLQRCIQMVNQDPFVHFLDPIPIDDMLTYAEGIYGRKGHEIVERILETFKVKEVSVMPITKLSGGQLRRLAIAKALIADPEIVILDEPLMWLDDFEGMHLLTETLRMLKVLGKTVIVFEHRFLHLIDLCDGIYNLKNGLLYKLDKGSIYRRIVADTYTPNRIVEKRHRDLCKNGVALELKDVWFRYDRDSGWLLKGIELTACRGDTVVIYGRNGSGKSTLLRIIAGVLKPTKGTRRIYTKTLYVPQIPYLFITEDSVLSEIKAVCRYVAKDSNCVDEGIDIFGKFGFKDLDTLPINLSWGQQTRLAVLLSYIASRDGLVILDEPFTGSTYLDGFNLAELLLKLDPATKIITLSSKDYIPLLTNARVYVLDEGTLRPFIYEDFVISKIVDISRTLYELH